MITEMPEAGPSRTVPLPHAHERTLDNGMRVIAVSRGEIPVNVRVPLVSAVIAFARGSAHDPPGLFGLAAMTAALLGQGTLRRSALELGAAIDVLGARLDKSASYDASSGVVSATTTAFPAALELLAETVREPAFAQDEFERVRAKSLSDLRLTYSSASSLARLAFARAVGGGSPYAHPVAGTVKSLSAMTRDDVAAFHARGYRPERATLLIGGEIEVDEAFALAERAFGDWRDEAVPDATPPWSDAPPPRRRAVVIDKPDAGRTALLVGRLAIPRASEAYYSGLVTCAALSGYSGRLNQEIRVKRGLSYGAGAQLLSRGMNGTVLASTLVDHTRAIEATEVTFATLASLADNPPDDAELVARKASLLGGWNRTIDTNDGLLSALTDFALYALPLGELALYTPRVEAIGAHDIATFARTYVLPEPCIVLVGNAGVFLEGAKTLAGDVEVIASDDLDLDAAM